MKKEDLKPNIYFVSDTHYGHKNICRGTSEWGDSKGQSTRDFDTLGQMNQAIVDGINKYVGEDDILYHLGDWSFGGIEQILKFMDRIYCSNIHLILGNHDHHIKNNKEITGTHFKTRNLFTSVNDVLEITINKQKLFLSHYAHRVWNHSHKGVIHLFGHSHGSLPMYGKSMDVGIDVAHKMFGEYRPFHFDEIMDIMNKREVNFVDHHSKETN